MDWDEFKKNLASYLSQHHDATLEDFEVVSGKGRIFVIDQHRNDIVWEFEYLGEADWHRWIPRTDPRQKRSMHVNPSLLLMTSWVTPSHCYECVVPAYPWVVGAIIFS